MRKRVDPEGLPPVHCWFCGRSLPVARVLRDGIILSREERRGGPRRLLVCPSCFKENLCEETRRGRWFASPNLSFGLLEILFSQLPGAATEEVLAAISWYRDNEERRRLYFERDGDERYQGGGLVFLRKLWPWWKEAPRPERKTGSPRGGAGTRDRPRPAPPPPRPRVVTPYEVLGVPPRASPEEIRRAFHRLAVQYHPDKVHHLGEEFQAMAHLKFLELKRAYEALMGR